MLTEEQRMELKKAITDRKFLADITQEELEQYPVSRKELYIALSAGPSRIIQYEAGEERENRPVIVNFHGGGFVAGRGDRDELFCRKIAHRLKALVLDVDYKLAPQYPYPAAVEECWDIAQWIHEKRESLGYHPDKMVFMGHSAGGNLVAGICMRAGQSGSFTPCCAVLDYPPLDLYTDPADKTRTSCDMPAERQRDYNKKYISRDRAKEPYASPVYAPDELLEHFPDTLIITAGEDSLCREGEEFAMRLMRSGAAVTGKRFADSIHGFVINRMCQWEEAVELIENFVEWQLTKFVPL